MPQSFPIYEIGDDAAEAEEAMGTKPKFWLHHAELNDCLFKVARPGTGEDWSEKIAAELSGLLGLPHARYELATWKGKHGILSPSFLPQNTALLHGNDILAGRQSSYPKETLYGLSQHTLSSVLSALNDSDLHLPIGWRPLTQNMTAVSVFVGYWLLDAWIGNGDRHHENWGFIIQPGGVAHLSPTYDHASCLGRELQDTKRQMRLQQQTVGQYAKKSRSAFYQQTSDRKAILTFDAFVTVANRYPRSALLWLNQLESISHADVKGLLNRIPKTRISAAALAFAMQMLELNQDRLLTLKKDLSNKALT